MTKSQKKTMIVTLAVTLVLFIGFGMISSMTQGFTNFEVPEPTVNESNFYGTIELDIVDRHDPKGLKVSVEEETGAFTLNGKPTEAIDYTVGTIVLNKGEYKLEALDNASHAGVYLTATANGKTVEFDFTPDNVLTIASDNTEVTIQVYVAKGVELNNVKVLPVIYTGDESVDFYG